jgi:predicted deacetylase
MNSQKSGEDRKLLVAIHDVGPKFDKEVDILASLITDILGTPRFSMLVVPNHWGEAPLWQAPAFCRRLRDWSDEGVEMFAHGWFHRDYSPHRGVSGLKARTMTAGEGEFLGLDRDEAAQRMTDGKALIEDIIGREVAGFIAPAWLYGPGSREALQSSSYRLAEDHMRVWRPQSSKILAAGPVITWASRSRSRRVSSIAFAGFARKALRILPTVRIAVHPGDTARPELMTSLHRTITEFALQRQSSRYLDLIPSQADEALRTNITKN